MKRIILVVVLGLMAGSIFSQTQTKLDSLKVELNNFEDEKKNAGSNFSTKKDSVKANLLDRIGEVYLKDNKLKEALANFENALRLHKELKDKNGIAVSNTFLGQLYSHMELYQEALKYDLEAVNARESLGNNFDIGKAFEVVGNEYENMGDRFNALINHEKALKYYLLCNGKKNIAMAYHNVGRLCFATANMKRALDNEHKALYIAEQIGDSLLEKKVNTSIHEIQKQK